jgi:polyhydroxyalkanoate synthesis regulator phasin
MLSHQTRIYNEILQRGGTHDDIMYDTFKALATTTNDEFETFVKDLKSKWETQEDDGNELSHDSLIEKCNSKYNNLVEQRTWKDNQSKNAKLVALATQVKTLEQKLASNSNHGG